jgi:H/ACA ribonucleoprotein complex non-core subunit NAF1
LLCRQNYFAENLSSDNKELIFSRFYTIACKKGLGYDTQLMATDDLQIEAPPSKRARLEEPEQLDNPMGDDMDDIYSTAANTPGPIAAIETPVQQINPTMEKPRPIASGIPGLGLLGQTPKPPTATNEHVVQASAPEAMVTDISQSEPTEGSTLAGKDDAESPSVTTALEAMLGGLEPQPVSAEIHSAEAASKEEKVGHTDNITALMDTDLINGLLGDHKTTTSNQVVAGDHAVAQTSEQAHQAEMMDVNEENVDPNQAEFELDSSPYASSSDDSDSDSSSSDDSEDAYQLLDPAEQARILMQEDGGSDDELTGAKGSGGQLRTKNEVPEEIIPKPDVTITSEMRIEELGAVEAVVESILLIKAKTSGEYRVLESGSVLCLADRSVIGVVSETLGRVQQPLYSVRFTNATEIAKAGLSVGTKVYYSEQHSTYVFTQALKAHKGTDASNIHDEEVGDEEIEFSDDEAEAEHKRRIKQKKIERRGGKMQQNNGPRRGGHSTHQSQAPYDASIGLSYDDEDEGPYKPLSRPAGFASSAGRSEAAQEGAGYGNRDQRGGTDDSHSPRQSRDSQGRGRGRGDRDRGRGDRGRDSDRGRGRGGFQDRRNDNYPQQRQDDRNSGYSRPPQGPPMPPIFPQNTYNYNQAPQEQYNPQQPHYAAAYPTSPPQFQRPQSYMGQVPYPQQPAYPPAVPPPPGWPSAAPMPTGAFINPAFFGGAQQPSAQPWMANQQQHSPDSQKAFQEAQDRLNILRNLNGGGANGQ